MIEKQIKDKLLDTNINPKISHKISNNLSSGLENYDDGLNDLKGVDKKMFLLKKIAIVAACLISVIGISVYMVYLRVDNGYLSTDSKISIQRSGNKVYYQNFVDSGKLYSMDLNGENSQKLSDDSVGDITIDKENIYYINYSDKDKIYNISKNGKNKKEITKINSDNINLAGDWIYFSSNGTIYKIKNTGEQSTLKKIYENDLIVDSIDKNIFINEGKIFVAQNNGLVLVNEEERSSEVLVEKSRDENDYDYLIIEKIINNYIYYTIGAELYVYNISTKSNEEINIQNPSGTYYITDNDIYILVRDSDGCASILAKRNIETNKTTTLGSNLHIAKFIVVDNNIFAYHPANGGELSIINMDNLSKKVIIEAK